MFILLLPRPDTYPMHVMADQTQHCEPYLKDT